MSQPALEIGLVIKRFFPHKQQICVLTKTRGKISFMMRQRKECQRLWPGMIIKFYCEHNHSQHWIQQNSMIIGQFHADSYQELVWTHQLFELCYYFIPSHNPAPEYFNFLINCLRVQQYQNDLGSYYYKLHIATLIHLFSLLSFYSNKDFFKLHKINCYLVGNTSTTHKKAQVYELQSFLNSFSDVSYTAALKWISECIQQHPCSHLFKTIQ